MGFFFSQLCDRLHNHNPFEDKDFRFFFFFLSIKVNNMLQVLLSQFCSSSSNMLKLEMLAPLVVDLFQCNFIAMQNIPISDPPLYITITFKPIMNFHILIGKGCPCHWRHATKKPDHDLKPLKRTSVLKIFRKRRT